MQKNAVTPLTTSLLKSPGSTASGRWRTTIAWTGAGGRILIWPVRSTIEPGSSAVQRQARTGSCQKSGGLFLNFWCCLYGVCFRNGLQDFRVSYPMLGRRSPGHWEGQEAHLPRRIRFVAKSPMLQNWYLKSLIQLRRRVAKPSKVRTYGFRSGVSSSLCI